jgi:thiol-disulfide isomerase/thioredoxin
MDLTHFGSALVLNRISRAVILSSCLVLLGCTSSQTKEAKAPSGPLTFDLKNESGQAVVFKSGSKPSVVSFSSTWCEACKRHRKDFHRLYKAYNKKGIEFYFIRVGEGADEVRQELKKEGAPYKHLFDKDASVSEKFQISETPTILIYHKNGEEIYRSAVYDEEEITASLNQAMK